MKSTKTKMEISSPEYKNLVQNLLGKKVEFEAGASLPPLPTVPIIPSPSHKPSPNPPSSNPPSSSPPKKEEKQIMFSGVKDVDKMILLKLDIESLRNVCQVNKYAAEICNDKNFWRNKIAKDFPLRGKFIWYTPYRDLYKNSPKQLYEIINRKSKIVSLNKKKYPALAKKFQDDFGGLSDKDLRLINEKILPDLKKLPLLRGDVIHFEWIGKYRNSGKLMWTGEKAVELYSELDDYGTVTEDFAFPEFPIDHFYESIDHNNLIWISPEKVQEIIKNFDEKSQKSFVTDLYNSIPVIAGAKNEEDKLVRLNREQFADFVTRFPFFDDNIHRPEYAAPGTGVIAAWFGRVSRLHYQSEEESSSEDDEVIQHRPDEIRYIQRRPGEIPKAVRVLRR